MKNKQVHILNGDALKEFFPKNMDGEIIVARECLMAGNVEGEDLAEFFKNRARFIAENYAVSENYYFENTATEFYKIETIPEDSEINLWFEDDLFCQVNMWFVISLIINNYENQPVYLVRPKKGSEYSFGNMTSEELALEFHHKIKIEYDELMEFGNLWKFYKKAGWVELQKTAEKLYNRFPFLQSAVNAQLERLPKNGRPGRPQQTLAKIIQELKTTEFEPVFKEFCKREAIYGFGDLQVKQMLGKLSQGPT